MKLRPVYPVIFYTGYSICGLIHLAKYTPLDATICLVCASIYLLFSIRELK